jgi:hypothetical protein
MATDPHTGMQIEATRQGTPSRQLRRRLAEHVALPESSDGLVGSLSEHGPARDRGAMEGVLLLVGAQSFFKQAAPIEEAMNQRDSRATKKPL